MKHSTYYRRIFIFFFIVMMTLSSLVLGLFDYQVIQNNDNDQRDDISMNMNVIQHDLDTQLTFMFGYLSKIRGSEEAYLWSESEGEDYYFFMKQVQKLLSQQQMIVSGLNYYVGVALSGYESSIVTANSSMSKTEYFSDFGMTVDDVYSMEKNLEKLERADTSDIVISQKKDGTRYIHYIISANFYKENLIFYLTLPEKAIGERFEHLRGSWILWGRDGALIHEKGLDEMGLEAVYEVTQLEELDLDHGGNYYKLKEHIVYSMPITFGNWKIYYVEAKSKLSGTAFLFILVLPALLFIIISYGLATLITKYLYRPVLSLIQLFSDSDELSPAKDEFKLILKETERLKTSNKNILERMSQHDEQLRDYWLKELLYGNKVKEKDLIYVGLDKEAAYIVGIVELKLEKESFNSDGQLQAGRDQVIDYADKYLKTHGIKIDNQMICIILSESSMDEAKKKMKDMIDIVEEGNNLHYFVGLGNKVDDLTDISKSFKVALNLMEYHYLMRRHLILTPKMMEKIDFDQKLYYPLTVETRIINMAVQGDEKVFKEIEAIIHENLVVRKLIKDERKKLMVAIKSTIFRIINELKIEDKVFKRDIMPLIEALEGLWFEDGQDEKVTDIIGLIMHRRKEEDSHTKDILHEQMKRYVHDNYADDIMLNDMAEDLNMSAKYCSALFKKQEGQNFKDYLNSYRIKVAKHMLETDPQMKISELALEVGFNTSNSFIRVFKKYVGMSPGSYSKEVNKNQQ